MRFTFLFIFSFAFSFSALAGDSAPAPQKATESKTGGICFRFDDNQTVEHYREMLDVFDKHGAKLCMSINLKYMRYSPEFPALLKKAQEDGHELMDHTPTHAVFSMNCDSPAEAASYAGKPSVDHVDGRNVRFKYKFDLATARAEFAGKVAGLKVEVPEASRKAVDKSCFVYDSEAQKLFQLKRNEDSSYCLTSFWGEENVEAPQGERHFKVLDNQKSFSVDDDALRLQVALIRSICDKSSLKWPVTWIQPGSFEPVLRAEQLKRVVGDELGYVSAATYPNSSAKGFCEPNPDGCRQYAMMWGDFSLEDKSVEEVKHTIASNIARHYVLIASSHMRVGKVPGGWSGYLKMHDELLAWCLEKGIPIRLQSEWAQILYKNPANPSENIIPSLTRDLDGNGVPDGFDLGKDVVVDSESPSGAASASLLSKGAGAIFNIRALAGLERGANIFSLKAKGAAGDEFTATFKFHCGQRVVDAPAMDLKCKGGSWESFSTQLEVPADAVSVDVALSRKGGSSALKVADISLLPGPLKKP